MFLPTEIFSKRRKIYAWWRETRVTEKKLKLAFVESVMIHLSCWWCLASCRDHCRCCSTPYISKHNIQRALKSFIMHHLLMISIPSGCSTVAIFSTVAIITHVWFQFTSICCLLCANKSKQHRVHASLWLPYTAYICISSCSIAGP